VRPKEAVVKAHEPVYGRLGHFGQIRNPHPEAKPRPSRRHVR
jgi:hypothetical protein